MSSPEVNQRMKQAFLMYYQQGKTVKEVANQMNRTATTIGNYISRISFRILILLALDDYKLYLKLTYRKHTHLVVLKGRSDLMIEYFNRYNDKLFDDDFMMINRKKYYQIRDYHKSSPTALAEINKSIKEHEAVLNTLYEKRNKILNYNDNNP